MLDSVERLASSVRNSQMLRLFSVGLLALLLQIPIMMIGALVSERQERRQAAIVEVPVGGIATQDLPLRVECRAVELVVEVRQAHGVHGLP